MFVLLGLAAPVWQLILLYTILAVFTAGIQPIASYVCRRIPRRQKLAERNRQIQFLLERRSNRRAGSKQSSNAGNSAELGSLYCIDVLCGFALILWRTAKEPELPLEREAYPIINVQDEEQPTAMSVLDYFDPRKLKMSKGSASPQTCASAFPCMPRALDGRVLLRRRRSTIYERNRPLSQRHLYPSTSLRTLPQSFHSQT